jgi:hypothetical protein
MDRITGNTIDLGGGRRGFRGRDLALGQAGTIPGPTWFNDVQEEICRSIEFANIVLAAGNREQLSQAMRRLAGSNTRVVTGNTTLTPDDAGLVLISGAAGAVTVTLPTAAAAGGRPLRYNLVRTDSTGNAVTVQRAGGDTIDGAASISLPAGARQTLVGDGVSAWVSLEPLGGLRFGETVFFAGGGGAAGFSGSWTVPAGVFLVMIEAIGAGGGGGGSAAGSAGGGGGGGAGGGGATASNVGAGGAGGTATGGSLNIAGAAGQAGQLIGSAYRGGLGGSAPFAGGVGYSGGIGAIAGCGGGGGWDNAVAPGAGAGGLVTISY